MNVLVEAYQGNSCISFATKEENRLRPWLKPLPTALNKEKRAKVANYPSHLGLPLLARRYRLHPDRFTEEECWISRAVAKPNATLLI
jgi:hypothetical protein